MTVVNSVFYIRRCITRSSQHINNSVHKLCARKLSYAEAKERRSELFSLEQKRQKDSVGRIEKIEVRYLGTPDDVTLVMNKGISTPYNCAQHLSETHARKSAVALLDGNNAWDMHRPIEESCTLQLLHFTVSEPHVVNRAFWRTCSFLLGASVQTAFKENVPVLLHSFPTPNVKSGSFVHDVDLGVADWVPTSKELHALSAEMVKLCSQDLPIERLDVTGDLAIEMFKDNPHKSRHIPAILAQNNGRITVYRAGNHVDISRGPMVGNTSHIGRVTVASVHPLDGSSEHSQGGLYRFQGVSLPKGIIINHFAYGILEDRAKQLNPARMPNAQHAANDPEHLNTAAKLAA